MASKGEISSTAAQLGAASGGDIPRVATLPAVVPVGGGETPSSATLLGVVPVSGGVDPSIEVLLHLSGQGDIPKIAALLENKADVNSADQVYLLCILFIYLFNLFFYLNFFFSLN